MAPSIYVTTHANKALIMSARPAEEIRRQIIERYNADQRGWQATIGGDSNGYFTTLFSHRSKSEARVWLLKEEFITPYTSVGLGVELEELPQTPKQSMGFGFRVLGEGPTRGLMADLARGKDISCSLIKTLLETRPSPTDRLEGPIIVQGPLTATSTPLDFVSRSQRNLELELRNQLRSLVSRRYPEQTIRYY